MIQNGQARGGVYCGRVWGQLWRDWNSFYLLVGKKSIKTPLTIDSKCAQEPNTALRAGLGQRLEGLVAPDQRLIIKANRRKMK